jgi:hypothetical protein
MFQHKHKIDVFEAKCSMLRNMVHNLSKGSHSISSNHIMSVDSVQEDLKEEDSVHQMMEDMDLDNQESWHFSIIRKEKAS